MTHIIVDFEMAPIEKQYLTRKSYCRSEIIEIGAVAADDEGNEIDSFKAYIKPEYCATLPVHIVNLTGIDYDRDLKDALPFIPVVSDFIKWCSDFGEFTVYSWSLSDYYQLSDEMGFKGLEDTEITDYMFDNWVDFQDDFCYIADSEKQISLENAIIMSGIKFEGQMHDALSDARNTALLFKLSLNQDDLIDRIESYKKKISSTETLTYTLADVIKTEQ